MATRSRRTAKKAVSSSTKSSKALDPKPKIQIGAGNLFALHVRRARSAATFAKRDQSIAAQEIVHRLEIYFGQRIKDPEAPIGKFVRGGAPALHALPVDLNRSGHFSKDGILFAVGAFDRVAKIKDLGAIIVAKYTAAGWHVY